MEKGVNSGAYMLGWLGVLGLVVSVAVGAALGYLEAVRRIEMKDMSARMHYLQSEIVLLRNLTDHLQQQLQTHEKKLDEEKSVQYYDDNSEYYDEDAYDEYRDGDDDTSIVQEPPNGRNRTRRSPLEEFLAVRRLRRAVDSGGNKNSGDRYNLIITQGPRRPPSPRISEVKAVVVIDSDGKERREEEPIRHPGAFRPYLPPAQTTSRPVHDNRRVYDPYGRTTPSYQEQVFREDRIRHRGKNGRSREDVETFDESNCCTSIAVQYVANTSKYRQGLHLHYDGNHRMYHPEGLFKDWTPHTWGIDYDAHFSMDGGHLTVSTPGLYYIYAQVFYADAHDTSGYRIYVNGEPQLQCTVTIVNNSNKMKRNSCYTGGLLRLQQSDRITLREVEGNRYTVFEHTKSFFGLFRVAKI